MFVIVLDCINLVLENIGTYMYTLVTKVFHVLCTQGHATR
jgi:hypothetical protein